MAANHRDNSPTPSGSGVHNGGPIRKTRILLLSDSRGAGLKSIIQKNTPANYDIHWDEITLPGATLETLRKKVERASRRSNWDITIVNGGICNLTHRIKNRHETYIEYKISKLEETRQAIDQIIQSLGDRAHICTITPASIQKYADHYNTRLNDTNIEIEQQNLLEDIEELNEYIKSRNIHRDFPTINLAIKSFSSKLKKQGNKKKRITKFNDKELKDGVHPSEHLKTIWAKYIVQMATKIANNIHNRPPHSDSSSEESENESWNFKRNKNNSWGNPGSKSGWGETD